MEKLSAQEIYSIMCKKTENNIGIIGDKLREFPATTSGMYFEQPRENFRKLSHIYCWTQSFFTGMALLAAENSCGGKALKWAESLQGEYYDKVFKTPKDTMHDLGFLYSLYSVMLYKLTKNSDMSKMSVKAAEVLAHRFVPNGKYIRAWGRMDDTVPDYVSEQLSQDQFFTKSKGLAIIDCMMNLPLLFWATEHTGDVFYKNIAMAHADTTIKYFVRADGSVCHAYRFNYSTGEPIGEFNGCGYSDGSHWARGTAWAIYGFALAYKYTKEQRYKDVLLKIAYAYIDACEDRAVPPWDFKLPKDEPARQGGPHAVWTKWDTKDSANKIYNVDASAACIAACGFLTFCEIEQDKRMGDYTDLLLDEFCEFYIDTDEGVNGLLKRINGFCHYGCYGDYFAMEFMARKLKKTSFSW